MRTAVFTMNFKMKTRFLAWGAALLCCLSCIDTNTTLGGNFVPAEETYTFQIKQEAYVAPAELDYNSASNLWKAADEDGTFSYFVYYAPGWSPLAGCNNARATSFDFISHSGSTFTLNLATATVDRWNTQIFFNPEGHPIAVSQSKKYNFQFTIKSNNAFTAFFKLEILDPNHNPDGNPKHEGAALWEKGDLALPADTEVVVSKSGIQGMTADNINMVFDFGSNPANTVITIKDIILVEAE